ncbi:MAG: hypothetical protein ACI31M_02645 [Bacilli bacterium]
MKEKLASLKTKWSDLPQEKKKTIIIIGALLLITIIILISFLITNSNKNKYESYYDSVEKDVVENVKYLKAQYINDYLGTDLVFKEKKFETKKMSDYEVLSYVINYFYLNNITDEIDDETITSLESDLKDNEAYILYKGQTIRDYAKKLLNINFKNASTEASENEIYNFKYISDKDIYIITPSNNYEKYSEIIESTDKTVNVIAIDSVSTSKTIKTTIAVAYTMFVKEDNNIVIKYYKDSDLKELVFEINAADLYILNENNELVDNPDVDKIENHEKDFNKYIVTSTKNGEDFAITSIQKK